MKKFLLALICMFSASTVFALETPNMPADIALAKLKDGNARYAKYQMKHPNTQKSRREKLIKGQHPFAVVLTCADSRVAPEIIFDQGLGDIFVIRNAGNVSDEHVMGSIEYAVHHLGVNLVIIMGHQFCGAVGAAMKDNKESPDIESIKASIAPAVEKCKKDNIYSYDNVIKTHAQLTTSEILQNKELCECVKKHDLKIIPAYYNVDTGMVDFLKDYQGPSED